MCGWGCSHSIADGAAFLESLVAEVVAGVFSEHQPSEKAEADQGK